MPCDLQTVLDQACESGIAKLTDPIKIARVTAQLICEAAESGGGGGEWEVSAVNSPALPYSFAATVNTRIEIIYFLSTGGGGPAEITFAKTGTPNQVVFYGDGSNNEMQRAISSFLRPGDTLTVTDTSSGGGVAAIQTVVIYQEQ